MKNYCVYKKVCGGDSCKRCKGTTKTEIKKRLKALDAPGCNNDYLRQVYTDLLKG